MGRSRRKRPLRGQFTVHRRAFRDFLSAHGRQGRCVPLQSEALSSVAARLEASPLCVALAWQLQRAPNILLIPGTSSVAHLRENLTASERRIPVQMLTELDGLVQAGWNTTVSPSSGTRIRPSRPAIAAASRSALRVVGQWLSASR